MVIYGFCPSAWFQLIYLFLAAFCFDRHFSNQQFPIILIVASSRPVQFLISFLYLLIPILGLSRKYLCILYTLLMLVGVRNAKVFDALWYSSISLIIVEVSKSVFQITVVVDCELLIPLLEQLELSLVCFDSFISFYEPKEFFLFFDWTVPMSIKFIVIILIHVCIHALLIKVFKYYLVYLFIFYFGLNLWFIITFFFRFFISFHFLFVFAIILIFCSLLILSFFVWWLTYQLLTTFIFLFVPYFYSCCALLNF